MKRVLESRASQSGRRICREPYRMLKLCALALGGLCVASSLFAARAAENAPAEPPTAAESAPDTPDTPDTASPDTTPPIPDKPKSTLEDLSLEDLMQVEVATVTTASKTSEKSTAAPATVIVITASDIRLRGYSNLKDVLRDLPGMETTEYYFSEIGTLVPVRGIVGNNKIVVLVNGMRVNPPGGENFPFRSDFSVRNAEQIEVIYGPGSTLYGQDAISAVINVKTQAMPDKAAGEIGLGGGSNSKREGWAFAGTRFGDKKQNSVTAYLYGHDSNLTRLDQEYPAWWQDYLAVAQPKGDGIIPSREDLGFNGFARVQGKNASLQLWRRHSRRSSSEGFSGQPPVLGYLDEARWDDSSSVLEGRHNLKISNKTNLDSSLTLNKYDIGSQTRYVFPASPTQWFLGDFKSGEGRGLNWEETLHATLKPNISLLAGIVASDSDITPKYTVRNTNFVYYTRPGDPTSKVEIPNRQRVKYHSYGAYLEMGWQASPKLKTTFGARLDLDSRFDDTPFSPRVAAVYDLSQNLKLKYIFTRAYVAPAPYFGSATYDNGTLLATSNLNLQPETASSHEVNLSYAKKNLNLGFSVYRGQQNNLILVSDRALPQNIVPNPDLTDPTLGTVYLDLAGTQTRTLVQSANGGDSHNLGADFFGRASFGRASTWFSYSYVDFKATTNAISSGLQGISAHNVRLGGTYAVTPKLFVTPSLIWRSTPRNVMAGALSDELQSPWEINMHAGYNAGKSTEIYADLRNLANHHYALGGISGFASPQETRRAEIGVRHSF